jgi:GR25 family glycosyltransferase involved in LPS biosynthesis
MEKDFAILVVAYKRPQALDKLLSKIALAGSFRVYIALDAPNSSSDSDLNADCVSVISKFEQDYSGQVHRKFTSKNLGCAVSVIKACNWVFEYEEFVVILEDDCHPENGFFDFVRDSRTVIENDRRVLMVCGTQFAPTEITNNVWSYSKYPLIWGWATTKPAWLTIEKLLKSENLYKSRNTTWRTSDYFFWRAGARRSHEGFVDAWDTPLVFQMQNSNYMALLPGQNLVSNIGDDAAATHTDQPSPWLHFGISTYLPSCEKPLVNNQIDFWLRTNFYNISWRHIFTTRITALLDCLNIHKRKRTRLLERL